MTLIFLKMLNEKKNINVGFIINYRLDGWLGVTNYYLNLFNTVKLHNNRESKINIIILSDKFITKKEKNLFKDFKVVKTNILNRNSRITKILNLFQIIFFGKTFS